MTTRLNIACPACGAPATAVWNDDQRLSAPRYLISCTKCTITHGEIAPTPDDRLGL